MNIREMINIDLGKIFFNDGVTITLTNKEKGLTTSIKGFPIRKEQAKVPIENITINSPIHTISIRKTDIKEFALPKNIRLLEVSWSQNEDKVTALVKEVRESTSMGFLTFICMAKVESIL